MKEYRIEIAKLISTELRSRTEAQKIASEISRVNAKKTMIDFTGVSFISRSFADEYCNVMNTSNAVSTGMSKNIKLMIAIVKKNRNKGKNVRTSENVIDCVSDASLLSSVLSAF